MRRFVLDTNVLVLALRQAPLLEVIERALDPFNPLNEAIISVASFAELSSFAYQHRWGAARMEQIETLLNRLIIADIYRADAKLQTAYLEIDAFSQGKHLRQPLNRSAVNMGKNDLWIAATAASATGVEFITTDKDFLHLDGVFFKVHYFPL